MRNILSRWVRTINSPSYVIFFVTAKCNAKCKMCFYKDNMDAADQAGNELTIDEYQKIAKNIKSINILGISGGEPFLREDLAEVIKVIYDNCSPLVVDLPTNGFFVKSVLRQAEEVARACPNMIIDLQLSIDGPEEVHNDIRGLKDGYARVKEAYRGLVLLKKKYKNLKVKACVVYSHYNQDHMTELFSILGRDFSELDRVVFSVVHGSVSNEEALKFDWERYFEFCEKLKNRSTVKRFTDFHSLFTIALRIVKNSYLKQLLKTKDMHKRCKAGKRVIVINETGKVFPCEPLWFPVGDLRANGYNLNEVLNSKEMKEYQINMLKNKCNCHWGLPMSNTLIYSPKYYPKILSEMAGVIKRSRDLDRKKNTAYAN